MFKFGKWIGGGIGLITLGPIGALIGFFLGAVIDEQSSVTGSTTKRSSGDYVTSLMVLVTAVVRADGKIVQSEIDYVKRHLYASYGQDMAHRSVYMIKQMMHQQIPVQEVSIQMGQRLNKASCIQIIRFLFGVAYADGYLDENERIIIIKIAKNMGIDDANIKSIHSIFRPAADNSYLTLGISKNASNDEIKRAYRKLALKYHPDKVDSLDHKAKKEAQQKFQKISEAYNKIKQERGLN